MALLTSAKRSSMPCGYLSVVTFSLVESGINSGFLKPKEDGPEFLSSLTHGQISFPSLFCRVCSGKKVPTRQPYCEDHCNGVLVTVGLLYFNV